MSEVIVVTSGKGGVGKTTTTANIGTGLAKLGKKVVMIDTDTGLRNLDVVLGLENRIVYNLVDVVEGNCRIKQALITDKRCPKLYLLPTAQTRDKSAVTPEQMIKFVLDIKGGKTDFGCQQGICKPRRQCGLAWYCIAATIYQRCSSQIWRSLYGSEGRQIQKLY